MKELFKFFVNPAPMIFFSIVLVILKTVGIEISWIVIFTPILIWNISLLVFVSLVLFGVKKVFRNVGDWIKKQPKV